MKKVFLVISPGRESTEALHFALHKAKEMKGGLSLVYIGQDRDGVKKKIEEIEKQARTFQVSCESELKSGDYFEICGELSRREDAALMVVTEKRGSFLKKVFEGSEANKLKDRVVCELKIY
ncbi:MAG: universal stress protein [Deltaproteobacteria bacterium]|nr:universal stress protein [Deltaproteobacteria bacterium]